MDLEQGAPVLSWRSFSSVPVQCLYIENIHY